MLILWAVLSSSCSLMLTLPYLASIPCWPEEEKRTTTTSSGERVRIDSEASTPPPARASKGGILFFLFWRNTILFSSLHHRIAWISTKSMNPKDHSHIDNRAADYDGWISNSEFCFSFQLHSLTENETSEYSEHNEFNFQHYIGFISRDIFWFLIFSRSFLACSSRGCWLIIFLLLFIVALCWHSVYVYVLPRI